MGKHETIQPGDARCPGPSTRDIILDDPTPTPPAITDERYEFLGDSDVSYDAYLDPAYHKAEVEKMWNRTWQMACREEHIPDAGDTFVYDVADHSILIARQRDMSLKAFINSCPHRGMQLLANGARENVKTLVCSFHGISSKPSGELMKIPCPWDFPHVDKAQYGLHVVHVASWGGFHF
ncbi:MAG: aromatic ring-hydroxylating dioxygenase subunit alpha, partial [Sphingomonadales bacterium]